MPTSKTSSASGFFDRESELADVRRFGRSDGRSWPSVPAERRAGIDKTRQADEFGRPGVAEGVQVVWGRCWEGGGAPAYWPWIQMVRASLADADAEQRAAILGSEATLVAQDIAQLLPELGAAHARTPRPPRPQPADPEQERFQLVESVATLLKNCRAYRP